MLGLGTTQATRNADTDDAFACLECSMCGDTKAVVGCAASASETQTVHARFRCVRHSRLRLAGTCPAGPRDSRNTTTRFDVPIVGTG
jgi:hypothetical protein